MSRLTRTALATHTGTSAAPAPVRIAHLGLGAFFRAHQAWYTDVVDAGNEWGIRAFTGRSPKAAVPLAEQEGLFTLIEKSDAGDSFRIMDSIVDAADGARMDLFAETIAAPETELLTLTITEAGYTVDGAGRLARDAPGVAEDVAMLRDVVRAATLDVSQAPRTALARTLLALEARRRAETGPFTIVPCDNLPDNGTLMRAALSALAEHVGSADLLSYVRSDVSYVGTSIDRITPATTPADIAAVAAATGWEDLAPVVTEPFTSWILSDNLRCERPRWEEAGALVVTDLEPFEQRKLWLLNGTHSLMAYTGLLRGRTTIAEAIADPTISGWVEELWDEACRNLPAEGLDLPGYRAALRSRYENSSIQHFVAQIGLDGVMKLRIRSVPVLKAERAAGREGTGALRALAAWVALAQAGELPADRSEAEVREAAAEPDSVRALLAVLDPELAEDSALAAQVRELAAELAAERP